MRSLWFRRAQINGQMTLYGVSVLLAPDHGLVGLTIIATGALKSTCVEVAGTNAKLCVLDPILRMLSTAVSVRTLMSQRCGTFPILACSPRCTLTVTGNHRSVETHCSLPIRWVVASNDD